MKQFLVIAATSDLHTVERLCKFFRRRSIPVMIETRTVRVDGGSAEGYRLHVPADSIMSAQKILGRLFQRHDDHHEDRSEGSSKSL